MVQLTVRIEPELRARLRVACLLAQRSVTEIVNEAVEALVVRLEAEGAVRLSAGRKDGCEMET